MSPQRLSTLLCLLTILLSACSPATTPAPTVRPPQIAAVQATSAPAATMEPLPTAAANQAESVPGSVALDYAPAGSNLVIKDAEMELLVRNTDTAIAQVTQMASDYHGYIISSQTWYQDGFKFASLRLGVPSAEFERALNYLRSLGLQVIRENATGQDVSNEYNDLQSQLVNLEATAARVRDFLKAAKTIEESLRINQQLAELEGQINKAKGQMKFYEGRAAFSTVTVLLTPQYPTPVPTFTPTSTPTATPTSTPTPTPEWNPGGTFTQASGVLRQMTQTTADGLIWALVVGGPVVLLVLLVLGGARYVYRKIAG